MAEYLKFVVKGQKLELKGNFDIYAGTVGYIGATFLFNSEWGDYTKVLYLQRDGDSTVHNLSVTDDKIEPSATGLNLTAGIWQFWIYGSNTAGSTITTNKVSLEVKASGTLEGVAMPTISETGTTPVTPTPSPLPEDRLAVSEYLRFVIKEQQLAIKGGSVLYSDTISYVGATFLFDDSWVGLTNVLHLQKDGDSTVYDLTIVDNKIDPSTSGMNLSSGMWQFWLHGTELEGTQIVRRLTTGKASLEVKQSGVLNGEPLPVIRETIAEQILNKAAYAERNAVVSATASVDSTSGTPSATVTFDQQTDTGKRINFAFTGLKGTKGDKGDTGEGVISGGTAGQVLSKKSATDYDTEWVTPPAVINNTASTATADALSANMGRVLQEQIDDLEGVGRFLSMWNCSTGLPTTSPATLPYTYKTGDYYRVSNVSTSGYRHTIHLAGDSSSLGIYTGAYDIEFVIINSSSSPFSSISSIALALGEDGVEATGTFYSPASGDLDIVRVIEWQEEGNYVVALLDDTYQKVALTQTTATTLTDTVTGGGGVNYKPSGSSYTGAASTTTESGAVKVGWVYYYDGTQWLAQTSGDCVWGSITGTLSNQTDLQEALDTKTRVYFASVEPTTWLTGDMWFFSVPVKGQLITLNLDGENRTYRVLRNVTGTTFEVMAMFDVGSMAFNSDESSALYRSGVVDNYLDTTWYSGLTSTAKEAIVDRAIIQDIWFPNSSGNPDYTGTWGAWPHSTFSYTISKGAATKAIGTRHVYLASVQDVIDYLSDVNLRANTGEMLSNVNIWNLFYNETEQPIEGSSLWLRSGYVNGSQFCQAWAVYCCYGRLSTFDANQTYGVRPTLCLDLSKINWQ